MSSFNPAGFDNDNDQKVPGDNMNEGSIMKETDEERAARAREYHRVHAKKSRDKRKAEVVQLQEAIADLKERTKDLETQNQVLEGTVQILRSQQGGIPLPEINLATLPPGASSSAAGSVGEDGDSDNDGAESGMDGLNLTTPEGQMEANPSLSEEDAKKQAAREYHRLHAKRSRRKKREEIKRVQQKIAKLTEREKELETENEVLKSTLKLLQEAQFARTGGVAPPQMAQQQPQPGQPNMYPMATGVPAGNGMFIQAPQQQQQVGMTGNGSSDNNHDTNSQQQLPSESGDSLPNVNTGGNMTPNSNTINNSNAMVDLAAMLQQQQQGGNPNTSVDGGNNMMNANGIPNQLMQWIQANAAQNSNSNTNSSSNQ